MGALATTAVLAALAAETHYVGEHPGRRRGSAPIPVKVLRKNLKRAKGKPPCFGSRAGGYR